MATSLLPAAPRLICSRPIDSRAEKLSKMNVMKGRFSHHHRIYSTYSNLDAGNEEAMPNHVGLIIDGHRRWAKKRGLAVEDGHRIGIAALGKVVSYSSDFGIKVLTIFVFSVQNWKRSQVIIKLASSDYVSRTNLTISLN